MKVNFFELFSEITNKPYFETNCTEFSKEIANLPLIFHKSLPNYKETPLISLDSIAEYLNVNKLFIKDESMRFGLKAFKGLGGSYCMFRILCEKFGLDEKTTDYSTFLRDDIRNECNKIEFVTATDGNHGKGISWAAKLFGCKAHVFMPKGSVEARRRAIEDAGSAVAEITNLNYDKVVKYAFNLAKKNNWIFIQDTSWKNYEKYPKWIIEGYLTMAAETVKQMNGKLPTHIFLQAGVGAMAGGVEAFFMSYNNEEPKPFVTIVEPKDAACIYHSIKMNDDNTHSITGNPATIMAGLNCGTPCSITWPIIRDYSTYFCACDDAIAEQGMRAYANPIGKDKTIISGESGAVTYGLLLSILKSKELRDLFKINNNSVILLFNTEGDTYPDGYKKILSS
ncbi:diaminopropionate ammonia-lyase [bacterium]|nr:diaminopropionate ammonia-lyase [bacterium]